ncbi:ImmA/IrrE family metallo-endopeptidase [Nocardioides sp. QY071]|uniref:ImmA/IrrE family metallo-endopeptidase n=1 Tax=Nocardioides sp. QY071 TaxID=3044187 RepID=UPI002499E1F8|nr:ImmA/IrrE family metallo-endopeptidase [Nocardioides sp. QY071]WGY03733.1 ImmA/IrrE family metallo-endopeptidase [Nocardioides sp. QY071]
MVAKTSPITPSVLEWGLHQDGRSSSAVASAMGVDRAEFDRWLSGDARPTTGQVSDLARLLSRPRAFFFLPAPPSNGAVPDAFRHPPGSGHLTVAPEVLKEARRAKRVQLAIAATVDSSPNVPRAAVDERPSVAAARAREWVGIPTSATWRDDYEALRWWKAALEAVGVLVFELQLGKDSVRGFAGWDERAPMIVINSSGVTPAARIYTIGHELAHLLLREATACIEPPGTALSVDTRTETWCERFAAAFLMPAPSVRSLMRDLRVDRGGATLATVKTMMTTFRVSARAAAARLADLGFADAGLYPAVLKVFQVKSGASTRTPRNPPRHRMRLRQYGENTVTRVFNSLPPDDALSVLRLTVDDARAMADEVPGVPAL